MMFRVVEAARRKAETALRWPTLAEAAAIGAVAAAWAAREWARIEVTLSPEGEVVGGAGAERACEGVAGGEVGARAPSE